MKELEVSAKTVEEAVQIALEQLGVAEDQVEIDVLKKGKSGVLGVGSEEALVVVKLFEQSQEDGDVVRIATDVLKALIKAMGIEAEVFAARVAQDELPVSLDIEGEDLGILIGRRGQTLTSLQYIVRLIVAEKLKTWVPINVDVAGYKKRRYESLQGLALRLAEQVKTSRRSINLEPMPADERRIIHMALSGNAYVTTESTGQGDMRKVVLLPKKR